MKVKLNNVLFVCAYGKMTITVNWTQHESRLMNKVQITFGNRHAQKNTMKVPTLRNTKKIIKSFENEINAQYDNLFTENNQSKKLRSN